MSILTHVTIGVKRLVSRQVISVDCAELASTGLIDGQARKEGSVEIAFCNTAARYLFLSLARVKCRVGYSLCETFRSVTPELYRVSCVVTLIVFTRIVNAIHHFPLSRTFAASVLSLS